MSGWESAADWWLEQVADDSIFETDVLPLTEAITPGRTGTWLDLGCGNGRVGEALGGSWISCDTTHALLAAVPPAHRPVRCRLPDLSWMASRSVRGALAVLVVEHIADLDTLFREVHRVVIPDGSLAVVMNHPAFTAEGAGPLVDVDDGEVMWRWGDYFSEHDVTVGPDIVFHHRPLGTVLSSAAEAGWRLDSMLERGLSAHAVRHHPGYAGQESIPRLLGLRWTRVDRLKSP